MRNSFNRHPSAIRAALSFMRSTRLDEIEAFHAVELYFRSDIESPNQVAEPNRNSECGFDHISNWAAEGRF